MASVIHWVLIPLTACLAAMATAQWLLQVSLDQTQPPMTVVDAPIEAPNSLGARLEVSVASQPESRRAVALTVKGRVVDPTGQPVAGVRIKMTGTDEIAESSTDGSFEFCAAELGCCRVVDDGKWLPIESPLLTLCSLDDAPTLVVTAADRITGRVTDADGKPVADARVFVELDVTIDGGPSLLPRATLARLRNDWSCVSNADGWYCLPASPIGTTARLIVEHARFGTAIEESPGTRIYNHVTLPEKHDVRQSTQHVVAAETATCSLAGSLRDTNAWPLSGVWASVVALGDAGRLRQQWGRFAHAPVLLDESGKFKFDGLTEGAYRIEAWDAQNRTALRTATVRAPASGQLLCANRTQPPAQIRGRVLDRIGKPVCNAKVGLARPTAWAVPGHLGMHMHTAVVTDRSGNFVITTGDTAALGLIVAGDPVVPRRISMSTTTELPTVIVDRRMWLNMPRRPAAQLGGATANLIALGCGDHALPIWCAGSPAPHTICASTYSGLFAIAAETNSLVWQSGRREVARLFLCQ